jgi:hypothetical protein
VNACPVAPGLRSVIILETYTLDIFETVVNPSHWFGRELVLSQLDLWRVSHGIAYECRNNNFHAQSVANGIR